MGAGLSVAVSIGVPLGTALGISFSVQKSGVFDKNGWYDTLKKPSWTPPKWLFGPVWTVLYAMMGVASWQVWKAGGGWLPLGLYAVQLGLNFAWTPLMFLKQDLKLALVDITALLGVLAATIVAFAKVEPSAALLMLPYLVWSSYATALTAKIFADNKQADDEPKELSPAELKAE